MNQQQLLLTQFIQDYDYITETKERAKNQMKYGNTPSVHQDNPYRFKIKFKCGPSCIVLDCHDQTVLDWGLTMLIKKKPQYIDNWINAYHFNDPKKKQYFFIGNLRDHRTSWIIISVFYFEKEQSKSLNGFIKIENSLSEKRKKLIIDSWKSAQKDGQMKLDI